MKPNPSFINVLKKTNESFLPVLKTSLPLIVIFLIPAILSGEYFYGQARVFEKDPYAQDMLMVARFGQFISNLLVSTLLILLVPLRAHEHIHKLAPKSFLDFSKEFFWPLFLEQLRVIGSILLRMLLLVIPGIHRYFRLILVPYVVYFHPGYQKGQIDALKASDELVKGSTFFVFVVAIIEGSFTIVFEKLGQGHQGLAHLELSLITQSLGALVSVYSYTLFYVLFNEKLGALKSPNPSTHFPRGIE